MVACSGLILAAGVLLGVLGVIALIAGAVIAHVALDAIFDERDFAKPLLGRGTDVRPVVTIAPEDMPPPSGFAPQAGDP